MRGVLGSTSSFRQRLLRWYDRCRRDLPWRAGSNRPGSLDPYHVLVSETMLQQTQVATVIPYFTQFLKCFPTLADLAKADEQHVLRLWQGLGYYSRARNLRAAARQIVRDFGGELPSATEDLLKLPGVGRYTAGAIASIAFGRRVPILDGNVSRVLCRLDAVKADPRHPRTRQRLWRRAEDILPRRRVGDFNSALMELGATVCTPRKPRCLLCPARANCKAFATGLHGTIPAVRTTRRRPLVRRQTFCIGHAGKWLIEQRPAKGRWAGMWQFVTVAKPEGTAQTPRLPLPVDCLAPIGSVSHDLTHRRYRFDIFVCRPVNGVNAARDRTRRWVTLDELADYPLPRPHVLIAQMLRDRH